jgi:hypothetical protein
MSAFAQSSVERASQCVRCDPVRDAKAVILHCTAQGCSACVYALTRLLFAGKQAPTMWQRH